MATISAALSMAPALASCVVSSDTSARRTVDKNLQYGTHVYTPTALDQCTDYERNFCDHEIHAY